MATSLPKAPTERVIRANLRQWIRAREGIGPTLVDELGVKHGKVRVDVCAIHDDHLHGYEIKSDQDTLDRLPGQVKEFSLVFHRMTLVIGPKLLAPALASLPPWWGIVLVSRNEDGSTGFAELREAAPNPKQNWRWVVRLLWRDEQTACLKAAGVKGWSKLKYWEIANLMLKTFEPADLTTHVVKGLRARKAPVGDLSPPEASPPRSA